MADFVSHASAENTLLLRGCNEIKVEQGYNLFTIYFCYFWMSVSFSKSSQMSIGLYMFEYGTNSEITNFN